MDTWDTIVALSSAPGRAGVAVIRLSGRSVRFAVETVAGKLPAPRIATLLPLRDDQGEAIDRGLVLFFPSPASFTGEDCAELQVHGSRAVVKRLIERLCALPSCRPAEAGEFVRRAFDNGKLDLAAVEGLGDLIDSETEWQRRQALRQMDGVLASATEDWRSGLVGAMALLEAEIDFSDEGDVGGPLVMDALAGLAAVHSSLLQALGGFERGERIRDGFLVALAGSPNAGKSTLLNRLARREVAIVSPIPGTTRDVLEVRLDLGGAPVLLVDTAGLREAVDPIETEGVRRARSVIERADLVMHLRAPGEDADPLDAAHILRLASKSDLGEAVLPSELAVSAITGDGIDALLAAIREHIDQQGSEPALLTRERHRQAVAGAAEALGRALALGPDGDAELIAEETRLALRALDRLIGRVDNETILDALFAGFCIGK